MQELKDKYLNLLTQNEYISKKEIDSFLCANKSEIEALKNRIFNKSARELKKTISEIENFVETHNEEFLNRKLIEEKKYFDDLFRKVDPKIELDLEQRKAILTDEDYILIIAGAGSGKTTTLTAKVKYLVDKKNIKPEEILLISYTNKAVVELKERINEEFKIPVNISTFHKLGLEIMKKGKKEPFRILSNQYYVVQNYFEEELMNDEKKLEEFIDFFLYYFSLNGYQIKDRIENKLNKLSNIEEKTIKKLKTEQLSICNYLYMNNVDYEIEEAEIKIGKYKISFQEKGKNLITLTDNYIEELEEKLKEKDIKIKKRNSKMLLELLLKETKDEDLMKLINLSISYLKIFKNKGYDKKYLSNLNSNNTRTNKFLDYFKNLYNFYEEELKNNHYMDFEDMINESYKILSKEDINLNYKYIIIDEYQDISLQRFNLTKELSKVTNAKVVAVGDDWQAIFAFAGSDVTLFTLFKELMGYGKELQITNTYRNSQELIDIAGSFVMKNKKQIKKELKSEKSSPKPIIIKTYRKNQIEVLEESINELIEEYGINQKLLIIGRYNFDKYNLINSNLFKEYSEDKLKYEKEPKLDITFLTAHSSKGLGFDNVILINTRDDYYGFPSKVIDDPIFKNLSNKEANFNIEEERRLFYVALTRSKNKVHLLTPKNKNSDFIKELSKYKNVSSNSLLDN